MKDYFQCAFCGCEYKFVLAVEWNGKKFCSHKHQLFYQARENVKEEVKKHYPDQK